MRDWLQELVDDEQSHLDFHCCFLQSQADRAWKKWLFIIIWRTTMLLAAIAVLIDHRAAIRDLGIPKRKISRRWITYSRLAERLVVRTRTDFVRVC